MALSDDRAIVLFSGGQDSATCLAWALDRFSHVETLGFDYGQRHSVEMECRDALRADMGLARPEWASRLGPDHRLNLGVLGALSETALTRESEIELSSSGLPSTFVPGRNLIFLNFAAALGVRRNARHIVTGVCETDYSGYPDCRDDTMKAAQVMLNLGMEQRFVIHTPLMWRDKAQTWTLAEELGGVTLVEAINRHSHSCYLGDRTHAHEWGYGCGTCPACELRANGWAAYVAR